MQNQLYLLQKHFILQIYGGGECGEGGEGVSLLRQKWYEFEV